jgi:hypothetical protein
MRKAGKRRAVKHNVSKLGRKDQKDIDRARRYAKLYGITLDQYDRMLERQDGKCALCRRPPTTTRLSVDHCHRDKRVRGLLCFRCNKLLIGRWKSEHAVLFIRAAKYLSSTFDGRRL